MAIVIADESNPFEMSVAMEVFGLRRPELTYQPYDVVVCSERPLTKLRDGLCTMKVDTRLDAALSCDTIIVPNRPDPLVAQSAAVLDLVRTANRRRKRLIGFCTGAFTLAAAGTVNDKSVTLHWRWVEEFQRQYPTARVVPDSIYVVDGRILTAAGSASALDLCLHVVREDHGSQVAATMSRRLVYGLHRAGGQRQFVEDPVVNLSSTDHLQTALELIASDVAAAHTVASMAAQASMGISTFHRHMRTKVGVSPMGWLNRQRVSTARRLLEGTDLSVDEIAERTGLGTSANLRLHFRRELAMSPTRYRASHRT